MPSNKLGYKTWSVRALTRTIIKSSQTVNSSHTSTPFCSTNYTPSITEMRKSSLQHRTFWLKYQPKALLLCFFNLKLKKRQANIHLQASIKGAKYNPMNELSHKIQSLKDSGGEALDTMKYLIKKNKKHGECWMSFLSTNSMAFPDLPWSIFYYSRVIKKVFS